MENEHMNQKPDFEPPEQSTTQPEPPESAESDSGGIRGRIPTPSLSRRQWLILGVVAVVLIALYVARQNNSSQSSRQAKQQLKEADTSAPVEKTDEDSDEPAIVIPANPESELEKDAAILSSGVFKTVGGGE